MYEKKKEREKETKEKKKEISHATSIITNTHAHPPYLLTHPLYIHIYIYNLESRIVLCALYRCLPASVTTSSILQSSHISIHPICNSGKPHPDPVTFSSSSSVTRRFETIETYMTHTFRDTRDGIPALGGPIARRFFVTW